MIRLLCVMFLIVAVAGCAPTKHTTMNPVQKMEFGGNVVEALAQAISSGGEITIKQEIKVDVGEVATSTDQDDADTLDAAIAQPGGNAATGNQAEPTATNTVTVEDNAELLAATKANRVEIAANAVLLAAIAAQIEQQEPGGEEGKPEPGGEVKPSLQNHQIYQTKKDGNRMQAWFINPHRGAKDFGDGPVMISYACEGSPMIVKDPRYLVHDKDTGRAYFGGSYESPGVEQKDRMGNCDPKSGKCPGSFFSPRGCETPSITVSW